MPLATEIADLYSPSLPDELTKVTPDEFVSLMTSRESVERVDGLPASLVGLRDCVTGAVFVVNFSDLARFQAAELGHKEHAEF